MLSGSAIPGLFDALSMSFDCRLVCVISAGHGVIVCVRLSGWQVWQYRRRVFVASNRHTAPRYFRCMGELGSPKSDRPKRVQRKPRARASAQEGNFGIIWSQGSGAIPVHGWHLLSSTEFRGSDECNPRACEGGSAHLIRDSE